jgi:hypothetical protein
VSKFDPIVEQRFVAHLDPVAHLVTDAGVSTSAKAETDIGSNAPTGQRKILRRVVLTSTEGSNAALVLIRRVSASSTDILAFRVAAGATVIWEGRLPCGASGDTLTREISATLTGTFYCHFETFLESEG